MKKKICYIDHIFHHLRWSLGIFLGLFCILNIYLETHAEDLLERAFYQAKTQETIINLGDTKNAVGNEILRESVGLVDDAGQGCFVNGVKIDGKEIKRMICKTIYGGSFTALDGSLSNLEVYVDECHLPGGGTHVVANNEKEPFCQNVLSGDWDVPVFTTTKKAPLIVQIAKRMLRLTIVLSITMVIYNGVMYIIESAKGGEVKEATNNLLLIVAGILVALLSLGIINLISSIGMSTLK